MAFAVGYAVGAKAGSEGYDELIASFKAVRDSEEFRGLIAAIRSHTGHVLREVGQRLQTDADRPISMDEVLARVRGAIRNVRPDGEDEGATSPAS
jgi:hypothetical protein